MYYLCASAGSRARLNDGSLEGLRLVSEPDLQRGGGPRESLHYVAWEMQDEETELSHQTYCQWTGLPRSWKEKEDW